MRVSSEGDDDGLGFGMGLAVTCVRCGVERDWPEGEQRKLPAHGPTAEEGLTVTADTRCTCGARRVRIRLTFDDE